MNREKKYLHLRLKRAFKVYPAIFIVTLITFLSIAIACGFVFQNNAAKDEKQKISIGIVGDAEDTFLKIGIDALKNMKDSRFYIDIREMNESDAIEALRKQEISGYLQIPNGFIRSIFWGENIPAKYITLNAPEGFGTIISTEVAEIVSGVVTESQNGMYSMQDIAAVYDDSDMGKKIDKLMLTYVNSILDREKTYEVTNLGISDSLSLPAYYIGGMLLLLMLLWGISSNRVFSSHSVEYTKVLSASGVRPKMQVLYEYLAYLAISVLTLLLFAIIFGVAMQFVQVDIPELVGLRVIDCVMFIIAILPVIVMVTMMQIAIYELIRNTVAAVLVQFVLSIVMGYISGCLYPNYFFPELVQNVAGVLPVGAGFSYIRRVMSGAVPVLDVALVGGYIAVFFMAAVCTRKKRISGDVR